MGGNQVRRPLADVRGKTAFITGGSSGIGLGMAQAFSAAGMKVVFTYLRDEHRATALASFPKGNPGVHAIRMDTSDRAAFERAADEAEQVFGPVHLLCNNAGVGIPALVSNCSYQDWDWAMNVNLNGVFNGVHIFLPRMLRQGIGHIVTTSSSGGLVAGTLGVYVTTKFAVMGMMESLRVEMRDQNIGISLFCPGLVRTRIFDSNRNRPVEHGSTQASPGQPAGLQDGPPVDLMADAMEPLVAGEKVLEGVRNNDLYILSHAEFAPVVRERWEAMEASWSKDEPPAGRIAAVKTFVPDIYRVELEKKRSG